MTPEDSTRPTFGQPGWRRRTESRYGWDREFAAAVAGALAVLLFSIGLAHGDENTGTPADPKEMVTPYQDSGCSTDITFLPLPSWASAKMPPLPGQLTPMGTPTVLHKPAPAAVAETKPDTPPMPKKLPQVYPLASSKDPRARRFRFAGADGRFAVPAVDQGSSRGSRGPGPQGGRRL